MRGSVREIRGVQGLVRLVLCGAFLVVTSSRRSMFAQDENGVQLSEGEETGRRLKWFGEGDKRAAAREPEFLRQLVERVRSGKGALSEGEWLRKYDDPEISDILRREYDGSSDLEHRISVLRVISGLRDDRLSDLVESAFASEVLEIRQVAVQCAYDWPQDRIVEAACSLLPVPLPDDLKGRLVYVLGWQGNPRALPHLLQLWRDPMRDQLDDETCSNLLSGIYRCGGSLPVEELLEIRAGSKYGPTTRFMALGVAYGHPRPEYESLLRSGLRGDDVVDKSIEAALKMIAAMRSDQSSAEEAKSPTDSTTDTEAGDGRTAMELIARQGDDDAPNGAKSPAPRTTRRTSSPSEPSASAIPMSGNDAPSSFGLVGVAAGLLAAIVVIVGLLRLRRRP